jgi:hypothetical protein
MLFSKIAAVATFALSCGTTAFAAPIGAAVAVAVDANVNVNLDVVDILKALKSTIEPALNNISQLSDFDV